MPNHPTPTVAEYDDLIIRLERDIAWQNVRLENCKDPNGTLADYLRKRIQVIGQELVNVRRERFNAHGNAKKQKSSHRIDDVAKAPRLSTNRLDGKRANKSRGSRR